MVYVYDLLAGPPSFRLKYFGCGLILGLFVRCLFLLRHHVLGWGSHIHHWNLVPIGSPEEAKSEMRSDPLYSDYLWHKSLVHYICGHTCRFLFVHTLVQPMWDHIMYTKCVYIFWYYFLILYVFLICCWNKFGFYPIECFLLFILGLWVATN